MEPIEDKRQSILASLAANSATIPDLKAQLCDELITKAEFPELHFISSVLSSVLANPRPSTQPPVDPNSSNNRYHPYARPQAQQPPPQAQAMYQQPPAQYPPVQQPMYQQPPAQTYMPYGQQPAYMPQYPAVTTPNAAGGAISEDNLISLFVFYLPPDASDTMLQDLFVPFATTGKLESARVVIDKASGASKGFGFVNFTDRSDAQSAIDIMNGYQLRNKFLKVSFKK